MLQIMRKKTEFPYHSDAASGRPCGLELLPEAADAKFKGAMSL